MIQLVVTKNHYLVQGEVREENSKISLNAYDKSSLSLVSTCYHSNMITHNKILAQFMLLELQRILK